MVKTYTNRPNFLGSEVGLVLKTITVPANASYVVENDRKIVKAGTIMTSPYFGLLFQDVDITDGANLGSLVYSGKYIDAKLPATASAYVTSFASQGLFPIVEGSVTRPFGSAGLSKLSAPTLSASNSVISWASISNAIDYTVYDADRVALSTSTASSYTVTESGTYYVRANADNINYKHSDLASVSA